MAVHLHSRQPVGAERDTRLTIGLSLAIAALVGWNAPDWLGLSPAAPTSIQSASPTSQPAANLVSAAFSVCSAGKRYTCVVDGDTIWLRGQKIRISDIDTPEVSTPRCEQELQRGMRATHRMVELLNIGPFALEPADRAQDRYGRALFRLTRDGTSLGTALVDEGLAVWYGNGRPDWC